jgi:hypothetical protein
MSRGGARAGAGRKAPALKVKAFAGYKYTEEEYENIRKAINKYSKEQSVTKSRALYELVTK